MRLAIPTLSNKTLFRLVLSLVAFHAITGLIVLWKMLSFQMPITWSEQLVYLSATHTGGLLDLYSVSHLTTPPFIISIYGPIYYAIIKLVFLLFGASFFVGRVISVAALVGIGILLYVALPVRKITGPLFFFALFPVFAWRFASVIKPEYLGAFLSLGAITIYIKQPRHWQIGSVALFSLAILTKPTLLAGFLAVCCHLLLQRRYKQAAYFALSITTIVTIVYGVLSAATGGGFWLMTIAANALKPDLMRIVKIGFAEYFQSTFFVIALAGSLLFLFENTDNVNDNRRDIEVVSLYSIISFFWCLFAWARPGSYYTYFLEPTMGASLLLPLLLERCSAHVQTLRFLLLMLGFALFAHLPAQAGIVIHRADDAEFHRQAKNFFKSLTSEADDYVLTDVYFTFDLVAAGQRPLIYDNLMYHFMSLDGTVSYAPIFDLVRSGRVPNVILGETLESHNNREYGYRFWPKELLDEIKEKYTCRTVLERYKGGPLLIACSFKSQ